MQAKQPLRTHNPSASSENHKLVENEKSTYQKKYFVSTLYPFCIVLDEQIDDGGVRVFVNPRQEKIHPHTKA